MMPSLNPASATESLMVEQGWAPLEERKLLVHHGENASAGRFDRDHGAVHVAERVNRSLANDWVFPGGDIAFGDIFFHKRTGGEALVITAPPGVNCNCGSWMHYGAAPS